MPSGAEFAQAVVLGRKIYIGGGVMHGSDYKILEYTINSNTWKQIKTPVCYFAMAVVGDQLIISGGVDSEGRFSDQVWVLDTHTHWTQPLPPLPSACRWHTAVGYKRWMVVVGGYKKRSVEVLDTANKKWYSIPLPLGDLMRPSLAVIQEVLYVLEQRSTHSIPIPMLLSDAIAQGQGKDATSESVLTKWLPLPDTLFFSCAFVAYHGSMVAVGGKDGGLHGPPSSAISMHLPLHERWVKVAELPTERSGCTCVIVPETEELMIIGGTGKKNFNIPKIDVCSYDTKHAFTL